MDASRTRGSRLKRGLCSCLMVASAAKTGGDQLAPSGESQHQVRLDKSQGQVQIGADKTVVDPYGRAGAGGAQVPVLGGISRVVIQYLKLRGHVRADDLPDLSHPWRGGADRWRLGFECSPAEYRRLPDAGAKAAGRWGWARDA